MSRYRSPEAKEIDDLLDGVCPRCGREYSYIETRKIGGQVYFYAVHYYRDSTGKRRKQRCYLGPKEYIYASMLHEKEGLRFRGLVYGDRIIEYLDAIISYLESYPISPVLAKKLAAKFRELATRLESIGGEEDED